MINPWTLLGALLAALALLAGGYGWGAHATDNAWQAKAAASERAAAQKLKKEQDRADTAAGNYLRNQLDEEQRYADLQGRFDDLRRRAPLVVARPAVGAACAAAAVAADDAGAAPPPVAAPPAALGGPELSLAAVRLWNAALTGVDTPAGACGAAGASGPPDAACAQGSGLDVGDAWANHERNARSCARDRERYQALIDFLNEGR